jgi:hypothetical protein
LAANEARRGRDWQLGARGLRQLNDAPNPSEEIFDIFLSHAHINAEWVEHLAVWLEDDMGFHVWLDRWVLVPGGLWQQEMARGLDEAKCCTVVVGASTPAGWFLQEVQRALNRQAHDPAFRVIPVLAPESDPFNLPSFSELRTWADFRNESEREYALHVLAQGIRGLPVGRWPQKTGTKSAVEEKLIKLKDLSTHLEREVLLETQRELMQTWLRGV